LPELTVPDLGPVWLTLHLAAVTTLVLLLVGTPLAWWLAGTQSRLKPAVEAVTALPLVLPPTVLGFYLLVVLSPTSTLGGLWVDVTGSALTFSFSGLVVASVLYSLPFMVQPLESAFEALGRGPIEAAASLGASPLDAFLNVAAPLAARGFVTACVLTFAHTLGEFGVVLMVGGNIEGVTRTISIEIYDEVQSFNFDAAGQTALMLLIFSFAVLSVVYAVNRNVWAIWPDMYREKDAPHAG
jgi:molybdate transport system permease protein